MQRAIQLLNENKIILDNVIDALIKHGALTGEELEMIVSGKKFHRSELWTQLGKKIVIPPKKIVSTKSVDCDDETEVAASAAVENAKKKIEEKTTQTLFTPKPSKKAEREVYTGKKSDPENYLNIPFSEIEKALGLNADSIRKIEHHSWDKRAVIVLKPSFKDKGRLDKIGDELAKNNVEHFIDRFMVSSDRYSATGVKIEIYGEAVEDFIKFVKKSNSPEAGAPDPWKFW